MTTVASSKDGIDQINSEIYVMNANGSGHTRLTYNEVHDSQPDWGSTAVPPPELDTTPPVLTVPEDIVVDATTANGERSQQSKNPLHRDSWQRYNDAKSALFIHKRRRSDNSFFFLF